MEIYLQYYFWLFIISLFVFILERISPWRKQQKAFRKGIWQDFFWLVFNGHYFGILLATLSVYLIGLFNSFLLSNQIPQPESIRLLGSLPFIWQILIFLIVKDFIEWNIHRMLHRYNFLWEFHKLHHSIIEMDWIGNFRFHWMESVIYSSIAYFPLIIFGVDTNVIFIIAIINTLIGHLNHSNLPINWGPLRYVFNSSQMHIWHHDEINHLKYGQNFGITLSIWDWIFGTVYWPSRGMPERLGFNDLNVFPKSLIARLFYPFYKWIDFGKTKSENN